MQQLDPCTAPLATQTPPTIGHNSQEADEPFGLRAAWLHFANMIELRRLAQLHGRINRRKQSLDELVAERQRIMNRCIRRMRRQQGKN
ncbi:hypothetical protein DS901_13870 [Loktanella sp. D2R18]|uniref:hypothetical protein n=1 Tax=Rhodobacterales TaxID=204455 RepID=UPI000DFCB147|nr:MULTISPECIES: hypothetical protein [Rhodobacterales]MDO6588937.1 hypothetical protein [Yoonia sp. 1_MG-2023]RBW41844.1 hypothetical protein DS901_13870 [Loktanella sp. D2R18]